MTEQAMNIDAYNVAITTANVVQPRAKAVQKAWESWYKNLSWLDKNMVGETEKNAIEQYYRFTTANAKNKEEAKRIEHYNRTGEITYTKKTQPKKERPVTMTRGTVRQGSTGSTVVAWQEVLGVTADGKFGPQTKRATIAWQQKHGLTADGIVGPMTWNAVDSEPESAIGKAVDPIIRPIKLAATELKDAVAVIPMWQKIFGGFIAAGIAFIGVDELRKK